MLAAARGKDGVEKAAKGASVSKIKDSGTRRDFGTGSVRDAAIGKGRFDLLSPIALFKLAIHMEAGCDKYGDRNWEAGQPLSTYIDCAIRHMYKALAGMEDEPHAEAAMWNMHSFLHTREMIRAGKLPKKLDDLPRGMSDVLIDMLEGGRCEKEGN